MWRDGCGGMQPVNVVVGGRVASSGMLAMDVMCDVMRCDVV